MPGTQEKLLSARCTTCHRPIFVSLQEDSGKDSGRLGIRSHCARRLRESPALARDSWRLRGAARKDSQRLGKRSETQGESGVDPETPGDSGVRPGKTLRDSGTPRDSWGVRVAPETPGVSGARTTQKDSQRLGNAPRLQRRRGAPRRPQRLRFTGHPERLPETRERPETPGTSGLPRDSRTLFLKTVLGDSGTLGIAAGHS